MPYKDAEIKKKYMSDYNKLHPKKRRNDLNVEQLQTIREQARKKYARNPEPQRIGSRPSHVRNDLKRRYGITIEQWLGLLASQNGCCAACRNDSPGSKNWNIDHNQENLSIRGILCNGCNSALGLLKDDIDKVFALAAYLQRKPDFVFEVI